MDKLGIGSGKRASQDMVEAAVSSAAEASWHMPARNGLPLKLYDDVYHCVRSGEVC